MEITDIAGRRFGKLLAVRCDHSDTDGNEFWLFRCDCGNEIILSIQSVTNEKVTSCGCQRKKSVRSSLIDISGQRFDMVVALKPTEKRDVNGSVIWECLCDCGNTVELSLNYLRNYSRHSCRACVARRKADSNGIGDFIDSTRISSLVSSKNAREDNKSGHAGVIYNKKSRKWQAYISFKKVKYHLGMYKTFDEAVEAREKAEAELHDPVINENLGRISGSLEEKYIAYTKERLDKKTDVSNYYESVKKY